MAVHINDLVEGKDGVVGLAVGLALGLADSLAAVGGLSLKSPVIDRTVSPI